MDRVKMLERSRFKWTCMAFPCMNIRFIFNPKTSFLPQGCCHTPLGSPQIFFGFWFAPTVWGKCFDVCTCPNCTQSLAWATAHVLRFQGMAWHLHELWKLTFSMWIREKCHHHWPPGGGSDTANFWISSSSALWHCGNVQQPNSEFPSFLYSPETQKNTSLSVTKVHLRPTPESIPDVDQTHCLHAPSVIAEYIRKIRGLLWSSVRWGQVFALPAFFAVCRIINAAAENALPVMCRVGIGLPPIPLPFI